MIIVLGGGPTGLGAAWRLHELHQLDWLLLERSKRVGGLSASFKDKKGYTWDAGGHVLFSHYDYFDDVLAQIIPQDGWLHHERESWIRIQHRWVPYPFQMNIRYLKRDAFLNCVKGILALHKNPSNTEPKNFAEWLAASFGQGLSDIFMRPYNWKVWGYPPESMSWNWVGECVATVDLERIIENYVYARDDVPVGTQ